MRLIDTAVSVNETGGTTSVCAALTGRYDNILDNNITVTLTFTDSPLAGNVGNVCFDMIHTC